jgi:hypothetical protein
MTQSSPTDDLRKAPVQDNHAHGIQEDSLDRLLSGYFKSKMKQPWPAAPATPSRMPMSEPSVLAATRTSATAAVETPRNQPAAAGSSRDGGNKSRYTLAVSFAVLLGTCWYLSNGSQPNERVGPGGNNTHKLNVFPDATAEKPAAIQQIQKDKAEQGGSQPKIQIP